MAFTGDIAKMYHSVKTGKLEGHLRRLLWRECETDRQPDIYAFQVVTFGDRPAGCIAAAALHETANMFESLSFEAAQALREDSYMDDVVSGAESLEKVTHIVSMIEEMAQLGGFKFKDFAISGKGSPEVGLIGSDNVERVLGLRWKPGDDKIVFAVDLNPNKRVKGKKKQSDTCVESVLLTKRICLRLVNSMYDPLGLITPVTIKLKIMMKEQFVEQNRYVKWDEPLNEEDQADWKRVFKEIKELKDLQFPRCAFEGEISNCDPMLVCFVDASKKAYHAVVYVRYKGSSINVSMLSAKARVSPVKLETIPRLELMAAVLGTRLVSRIKGCVRFQFTKEVFLTDSRVVLGMLTNSNSLLKEFVGVRVSEIRSRTRISNWGWVPSCENIADVGTKGASPMDLTENSVWQNGPGWLKQPESEWPVEFTSTETPMDQIPPTSFAIENGEPLIDASKYSSLDRLLRVTAYCLKFAASRGTGKAQNHASWVNVKLTVDDFAKAKLYWIAQVSTMVYERFKKGWYTSLRPILVWDNVGKFQRVVTSGRLGELLKVGYDIDELTILDPEHQYTKLLLKHYHDQQHASDDKVVWSTRVEFWIPRARRYVKTIRERCYRCRLRNKVAAKQVMSPLPGERVLPTPPWTNVSLDLFGPLEYSDMVRKRLKSKCWGIIITCMVSRATHLDLTQSYDTDALLQAIRRFMNLRGTPKVIYSDQGSQMVAASKEVGVCLELINWDVVYGWCTKREIEWRLVPVGGQHMNACSESLIRICKKTLADVLHAKQVNFVELQTVLYEVAQIMNCRPLGIYNKPGDDPLDGGPITPNHLLLGRATAAVPLLKYENVALTKRIRFLQTVVEEFWAKWKVAAFQSLLPQYKWHRKYRSLKVGDIVLINDEDSKVGEFKLGKVVGTKQGKDGHVRTVFVEYVRVSGDSFVRSRSPRPVHKLVVVVPVEEQ